MNNSTIDFGSYADECVAFLQALVRTPSVNGTDNEAAIAELLVKEAERLGLSTEVIETEPHRPNVFVGEGFNSQSSVVFVAHADTVPVGDESQWQHGPFSGEIVDGKLYGRGAFDCKGGLAVSLYALKILKDQGKSGLAKMLSGADEESGADSRFGIRAVLDKGLQAKGAVYTYGGRHENKLIIGHRGVIRLWITCDGESAHSGSLQWQDGTKGSNAIEGIVELLEELKKIDTADRNDYFPGYKTVVTPTLITGGEGESLVPAKAQVLLDIRTLPEGNDKIYRQIETIVGNLKSDKRKFSITVKNNIPAVVTDPTSEIVKAAIAIKREVSGDDDIVLRGSGPANESYMLVEAGIPTIVGFGPEGDGFHAANEYADIASISKSLESLVRLAERLAR